MNDAYLQQMLRRASAEMKRGEPAAAIDTCKELVRIRPRSVRARLFMSQACQQLGDFEAMLKAAQDAHAIAPDEITVARRLVECQIYCGNIGDALQRLERMEADAGGDHRAWQHLAELYVHCSAHEAAYRCHRKGLELRPEDAGYRYNLASSAMATGRITEAVELLDEVIAHDPEDFDAWYNRATLRRWTSSENHIEAMLQRLAALPAEHAGRIPLHYALGKEHEDLGNHDAAWSHYDAGASGRRRRLRYRVEGDLEVIDRLIDVFDAGWLADTPAPQPGPGPVFIVGLPRTGTTLVDRILSSFDAVASLGEINTLAFAVIRNAGPSRGKLELLERSAAADTHRIGQHYLEGTRGYGLDARWLIDKTPLNYLYIGLIRRALPNAKIIHLRRHPLDTAFAIYKTLFRMGYPFSYDLDDLGRYLVAQRRLMAHWREHLPGGMIDVDYEALVSDPETEGRRLVEYCGLEWDPACLEFHRRDDPVATASAVQVREPIHSRSVGLWQHHKEALAPVRRHFDAAGTTVD